MRTLSRHILVFLAASQAAIVLAEPAPSQPDVDVGKSVTNAFASAKTKQEPVTSLHSEELSKFPKSPVMFVGAGPAWSTNLPNSKTSQTTVVTASGTFSAGSTVFVPSENIWTLAGLRLNAGVGVEGTSVKTGTKAGIGFDFGADGRLFAGAALGLRPCAPGIGAGFSGTARFLGGADALGGTDLHLGALPVLACAANGYTFIIGPMASLGNKSGRFKAYGALGGIAGLRFKDTLQATAEVIQKYGMPRDKEEEPAFVENREFQVAVNASGRIAGPIWIGLDASVTRNKSKDVSDVGSTNITAGVAIGGTLSGIGK